MLLPLLLTLALPAGDRCQPPRHRRADDPRPFQKAGAGLWIGGIAFVPADIADAKAAESEYGPGWTIELVFTTAGNARFVQAQHCGVGKMIEISINRHVLSRPVLNEPILGGKAMIVGDWKTREETEAAVRQILGR